VRVVAELVTHAGRDVDPDAAQPPVLVGWGALWLAIALNVTQVFLLDGTQGLAEPALLPIAAVGFLAELWLFGRAVRCLSPVIAYAAYGTTPAVVTILSVTFFGEALTLPKLAGVAVVTAGVVMLATDGSPAPPRADCGDDLAARPTQADRPVEAPQPVGHANQADDKAGRAGTGVPVVLARPRDQSCRSAGIWCEGGCDVDTR
jgi:small multidrug resistance pump